MIRPSRQALVNCELLEERRLMHLGHFDGVVHALNAAGTVYVDAGNTKAAYTDIGGATTWGVDSGFAGGKVVRGKFAVAGTDDDGLFASRRQGNFAYGAAVADGTYTLSLLFVDTIKKAGRRIFNVSAEGTAIETNLDIAARAGRRTALVVMHTVAVTGGTFDLTLTGVRGTPVLSAFSLVPITIDTPAPPVPEPPAPEPEPEPPTPEPEPPTPEPEPPVPAPPASPTGLSTTSPTPSSVALAWTDNASDETGFAIERSTSGGAFAALANVAADVNSYTDQTVSPGEQYAYRVRAIGTGGASEYSNTALASPAVVEAWSTGASAPIALGEVAGGIIGGKLYLVGEGSSQTFAYDIASNTWTAGLAPRPHVGEHHAAEVVNGKLYLFGGFNGGSNGKVQIYDPVTNNWTLGADMPFNTGSASSAPIGGKVYVAGGIVNFQPIVGGQTTTQAAVYDPASNTWSSIASMPRGANHAAAATDGSKLYIFGGRDGKGGVENGFDTVQIYDPATNTWQSSDAASSSLAPLPQARGGTGKAVFANGEFFVMGGETKDGSGATSNNVYRRVDVYNPVTNRWRRAPDMPTARHGVFPLLADGKIFVAAGGTKAGFSASNVLEILEVG